MTGSHDAGLLLLKYSAAEIRAKRGEVAQRLIFGSPNINDYTLTRIGPADLQMLFELYNESFFENRFWQNYHGKLKFSLSRRLTRSAGKTICPKNIGKMAPEEVVIEVRMGVDFFLNYNAVAGAKPVNGLSTRDALEALQLVFEHELCHVIEFINFHSSSCSRARFKNIAGNLFGHLESYHQLPTRQKIISETTGLQIGAPVSFMYGKQRLQGILYRLNKRATVMVKNQNGKFIDREGVRYSKYLVPVELLR